MFLKENIPVMRRDYMTEHTRFGPAGVPPMFRLMGATMADVPKLLREEGLYAF
jgi:hypothetical protein